MRALAPVVLGELNTAFKPGVLTDAGGGCQEILQNKCFDSGAPVRQLIGKARPVQEAELIKHLPKTC